MATIKPSSLHKGDTVGVVAPSDAVEKTGVERSAEIVKSWGLRIKYGKHIFAKVGDFMAGTPEERMEDLRSMIYDPEVKAIWCASGGYAVTEVMSVFDRQTLDYLKTNPKWFIGYSDICLILNALTSFKMVSVMGPTLWGLSDWDNESQDTIRKILMGESIIGLGTNYEWRSGVLGTVEGTLVVSNLELLIFSFGTKFDPLMYGGSGDVILGLEEWEIEKSTLQRQLDIILSHKRAGRIKAMFVSRLVGINELSYPKWGKKVTTEGLITQKIKKIGLPLAFCEDFGHAEWDHGSLAAIKYHFRHFMNRKFIAIPNGIQARLTVGEKECKLEYLESICNTPVTILEKN